MKPKLGPIAPLKTGSSRMTQAHTAKTKYGMGDNYGTGIKQPIGKPRSGTVGLKPVTKKQVGTPPKSLA